MKMGFFRASSWAHSQGTFRVRALGPKPRFWSTAKELQGTILYQYHGISTTVTVVVPELSDAYPTEVSYQVMEFVHLTCIISGDRICASDLYRTRWRAINGLL